ncbi:MAG: DUF5036 family protein [Muribaculaceae bacterium]|nr:DUF5036 family protein [Muribaculaceae bacterium]
MRPFIIPFLSVSCLFLSACSSNDDEPKIPTNTITVNMMNDADSQTTIGGSDVYINSANNFTTEVCGITDLGHNGNFGQNPNLSQIAQEVAVTPGNYYQIVLASDIKNIAGQRAYPLNTNFYNVYVDSWIYDKDNEIAGAKVVYAECFPETNKLPEWDAVINIELKSTWNEGDEYATYSFASDVEIDSYFEIYDFEYSDLGEYIKVESNHNILTFTNTSSHRGKVEIIARVRYESIFSRVHLIVKSLAYDYDE